MCFCVFGAVQRDSDACKAFSVCVFVLRQVCSQSRICAKYLCICAKYLCICAKRLRICAKHLGSVFLHLCKCFFRFRICATYLEYKRVLPVIVLVYFKYCRSILSIFATRFLCRSSVKSVESHASTIVFISAKLFCPLPKVSTFAPLCSREFFAKATL
jgi:hypothetical protein